MSRISFVFVAYGFSGSAGIQKKRENLTVARPTVRGLRIAHQCRTSNAEASRCMYKQTNTPMVVNDA